MRLTGKESIEIRNFGPIKDVSLWNLKKVNVFIGESGSGKSTVMKVLAMMRWIYKMICVRSYLKVSGISNTPFRLRLDAILSKNGLKPFLRNDTVILYSNGDFDIQIRNGKILFPQKIVSPDELTIQKVAYISDKRVLVPDLAVGNVALRHNMFYLDETFLNFQKAIDTIGASDMDYLGVKMNVRKSSGSKRVYISGASSEAGYDNLPLTSASSGIQSSVALHFIMQYFADHYDIVDALNSTIVKYLAESDNLSKFKATTDIGRFPNKRISIHVEEPELSLFPTNQWGLMKYLVRLCQNSRNAEIDMTLATHSPYILTALNVMTFAYRANAKNSVATSALIEDIPLLNPEDVGAWSVAEGYADSIIDAELEMIDGTALDTASDIYETLLGKLSDIIYG